MKKAASPFPAPWLGGASETEGGLEGGRSGAEASVFLSGMFARRLFRAACVDAAGGTSRRRQVQLAVARRTPAPAAAFSTSENIFQGLSLLASRLLTAWALSSRIGESPWASAIPTR